jgi:hypothetical protein
MFICVICRFEAELDDVIAPTSTGRCVCLRCFARETGTTLFASKTLHDDLVATLSAAGIA